MRQPQVFDVTGQYWLSVGAPIAYDWSVPFRIPANLRQRDQNTSSACTAEATDYYVEALNQIENGKDEHYSARHIYSQVFLPGGGAYIASAMGIPVSQGAASDISVPDGTSTEAVMTNRSDNFKAVLEARADKVARIPISSIDALAQLIKDYHGFVIGFDGWNGMFDTHGQVVDWSKRNWGHAVFCYGTELRAGVKCIVFKNSWGPLWGDSGTGYFPEAFVTSGHMYESSVYADVKDLDPTSMFTLVQVPGDKEVWLVKDGKRTHVYNQGALTVVSDFAAITAISQVDLDALPDTGLELAALVKE